ncbi:MAG: hypothetical protein JRN62_03555 [Nitrososphaerota archaeon]|jgi:hypothetical protein|nr:hypothetical protein [Nitrososphaerota archaeon]MDG6948677.1 hypothetical protein [Nitrososphaerota archaeon]
MILYSNEELSTIRGKLAAGALKFELGGKNLIFSKSKSQFPPGESREYLLQRNNRSRFLGLAFDVATGEFVPGYHHIDNPPRALDLNEYLASLTQGYFEHKWNGTMLGLVPTSSGIVYRTRGTISPIAFINEINLALIKNAKTVLGVQEPSFETFKKRYQPIFEEGRANGSIDEMGNVVLSKFAPSIIESVKPAFEPNGVDVAAVFGEFVSKYNPICVDPLLSKGIYLDAGDYMYVVFDVLARTNQGLEFLQFPSLGKIVPQSEKVKLVEGRSFSQTPFAELMKFAGAEEGVLVKTPSYYVKVKQEDVLAFERMLGRASTILDWSVKHVFEKGVAYSDDQLFEEKVLLRPEEFDQISDAVFTEMEDAGFGLEQLVKVYSTKGMTEDQAKRSIQRHVARKVDENLMTIIVPRIFARGTPINTLYLEIPKYVDMGEVLTFDTRRQKMIPVPEYAKMLSGIYGRTIARKG